MGYVLRQIRQEPIRADHTRPGGTVVATPNPPPALPLDLFQYLRDVDSFREIAIAHNH